MSDSKSITEEGLDKLVEAHDAYGRTVSPHYDDALSEVLGRVQSERSIGKADIGALLFWKRLRADTRWAMDLHNTSGAEVRRVTGSMFVVAIDPSLNTVDAAGGARGALSSLPGFVGGDALASALILAAAPSRMAIYDKRAHAGLRLLELELTSSRGRYRRYMTIVERIREEAAHRGIDWTARDVDKALFWLGQ